MHYGRFCRESGRWVKIGADQAPPIVSPDRAAEIVPVPEEQLRPVDDARIGKDASRESAPTKEATPP